MKIGLTKAQVLLLMLAILQFIIAGAYLVAGLSNDAHRSDMLPWWVTFSLLDSIANFMILLVWVVRSNGGSGRGKKAKCRVSNAPSSASVNISR